MGETAGEQEYRSVLNIAEARQDARSLADEGRLAALVGTLTKENPLAFDYDANSGFLYVGARRKGTRFGMIARGNTPHMHPLPRNWTLDYVVETVGEENIVHNAMPVLDQLQPIASVMFLQGVEHKVPYGTRKVRVRKGNISFWPDGIAIPSKGNGRCFEAKYRPKDNQRPTGVSFNFMRLPTWHYPELKQ